MTTMLQCSSPYLNRLFKPGLTAMSSLIWWSYPARMTTIFPRNRGSVHSCTISSNTCHTKALVHIICAFAENEWSRPTPVTRKHSSTSYVLLLRMNDLVQHLSHESTSLHHMCFCWEWMISSSTCHTKALVHIICAFAENEWSRPTPVTQKQSSTSYVLLLRMNDLVQHLSHESTRPHHRCFRWEWMISSNTCHTKALVHIICAFAENEWVNATVNHQIKHTMTYMACVQALPLPCTHHHSLDSACRSRSHYLVSIRAAIMLPK